MLEHLNCLSKCVLLSMHDFPCSLEYLRQVAGPRTVPVELGVRYTDEDWSQKLMTLSEFIDKHVLREVKVKYLFIYSR